jgi:hypothetical protein
MCIQQLCSYFHLVGVLRVATVAVLGEKAEKQDDDYLGNDIEQGCSTKVKTGHCLSIDINMKSL